MPNSLLSPSQVPDYVWKDSVPVPKSKLILNLGAAPRVCLMSQILSRKLTSCFQQSDASTSRPVASDGPIVRLPLHIFCAAPSEQGAPYDNQWTQPMTPSHYDAPPTTNQYLPVPQSHHNMPPMEASPVHAPHLDDHNAYAPLRHAPVPVDTTFSGSNYGPPVNPPIGNPGSVSGNSGDFFVCLLSRFFLHKNMPPNLIRHRIGSATRISRSSNPIRTIRLPRLQTAYPLVLRGPGRAQRSNILTIFIRMLHLIPKG